MKTDTKVKISITGKNVGFVGIDLQKDFSDNPKYNGALPVAGASEDLERLIKFFGRVASKLKEDGNTSLSCLCTQDWHPELHISFDIYWTDKDGNHPSSATVVSFADTISKWINSAGNHNLDSLYIKAIESNGMLHIVWPVHCVKETTGAEICDEWLDVLNKYNIPMIPLYKGMVASAEMYGALAFESYPLYSDKEASSQIDKNTKIFLNFVAGKDIVFITGQALSHCVLTTIKQFANIVHYINSEELKKCYLLIDTSSCIPGFEEATMKEIEKLEKAGLNVVKTTDVEFI